MLNRFHRNVRVLFNQALNVIQNSVMFKPAYLLPSKTIFSKILLLIQLRLKPVGQLFILTPINISNLANPFFQQSQRTVKTLLRIGHNQLDQAILSQQSSHPPVKKPPTILPLNDFIDDIFLFHAARRVVQIGKGDRYLMINGNQLLLSALETLFELVYLLFHVANRLVFTLSSN
ncbi:hypothetical protein BpHYR1_051005 [Brachionus plicatilis]|uniref:Uncharacterized protein n=1 Tax=Brachionus plicatilis TaxID=10195 RepID=A0A3M7SQ00_BRAPC|nr:hypothetical protein BpHYR1_051005 [Brachionus plicatilis]